MLIKFESFELKKKLFGISIYIFSETIYIYYYYLIVCIITHVNRLRCIQSLSCRPHRTGRILPGLTHTTLALAEGWGLTGSLRCPHSARQSSSVFVCLRSSILYPSRGVYCKDHLRLLDCFICIIMSNGRIQLILRTG